MRRHLPASITSSDAMTHLGLAQARAARPLPNKPSPPFAAHHSDTHHTTSILTQTSRVLKHAPFHDVGRARTHARDGQPRPYGPPCIVFAHPRPPFFSRAHGSACMPNPPLPVRHKMSNGRCPPPTRSGAADPISKQNPFLFLLVLLHVAQHQPSSPHLLTRAPPALVY